MDEELGVEITKEDRATVVVFKSASISEVDMITAASNQIKQFIDENKPDKIIFDFDGVKFFSSQVLGLLLDIRAKLKPNDGEVVIEHFGDAYKDYWNNVDPKGDIDRLMRNIAQRYFMDKIENFAFRPSKGYREHLVKMAKEFKVDGVIWYQPMYQDNADFEFSLFKEVLEREYPLPLIKLYTEYDSIERPSMETRVETFVTMITEKK